MQQSKDTCAVLQSADFEFQCNRLRTLIKLEVITVPSILLDVSEEQLQGLVTDHCPPIVNFESFPWHVTHGVLKDVLN